MPNVTEGGRTKGLLAYLVGPGRSNEHTDPHLVAGDPAVMAWHGSDELAKSSAFEIAEHLDAPMLAFGTRARGMVTRYEAGTNTRVKVGVADNHVWHCSLSLRAYEGELSDELWGQIATEFVEAMGFGDENGSKAPCRWVAVRHGVSTNGNDHIHVVVNRVREDGTKASNWDSWRRSQRAVGELERRHGLQILESRQAGRGARGLSPAEQARQERTGVVPERFRAHRLVRAAAVQAGDEAEFVRRARRAGLLIRPRYAAGRADVVTGYSVAVRPPAGEKPVWFGGGQLARDLTLPRLREHWPDTPQHAAGAVAEWNAAARGQRVVAPGAETRTPGAGEFTQLVDEMRAMRHRLGVIDPRDHIAWAHVARQASGLLATWSTATEPEPGPLAAAAREVAVIASTHARGDRTRQPMAPAARGMALVVAALDPHTPGAVRAAIVAREITLTVQAVIDAARAAGQLATATRLQAAVTSQLAPVHAHLHAEVAARQHQAHTRAAPVPTAAVDAPAPAGDAAPRTRAEELAALKERDPQAWKAAVLREKVFGRMGSPVPSRLTPGARPAPTTARPAPARTTDSGTTGAER